MPVSSVSDFERFALKVKKHITDKVKKSEEDVSAYALQEEEKSLRETEKWLQQVRSEWEHELNAREQQGLRTISDEVNREWSTFRKEREMALKKAVEERLGQSFPLLAECFIAWVLKNYKTGSFTLPKAYGMLINREGFDVRTCEEKQVIFSSENLYIEYSVERIIEELNDEIAVCMHFEEDLWPV
ncbi:MAG: hypothetical protein U9Q90_05040 [Campylobacterota bacterium]|nr:hypothetical protein [Campylobacterota bacterium]